MPRIFSIVNKASGEPIAIVTADTIEQLTPYQNPEVDLIEGEYDSTFRRRSGRMVKVYKSREEVPLPERRNARQTETQQQDELHSSESGDG